jgi:CheY-like chemotaxis protein
MHNQVVLYVEDDATDIFFCRETIKKIAPELDLRFVHDGEVAMEWLSGEGTYANRSAFPMPGMVVTDLEMLHVTGLELLGWIRDQPHLKDLPVVVHATSSYAGDIGQCKRLGATNYLVKEPRCVPLIEFLRDYFTVAKRTELASIKV